MSAHALPAPARTRWAPAAVLLLLAPLIAEYLLGSMAMRQIALRPVMAAMYGSGALLVREVARRTGRGWATIALPWLVESPRCRFAFVAAGLAVYAVFGFQTDRLLHGTADIPAHAGLVVGFALIAATAWRRTESLTLDAQTPRPTRLDMKMNDRSKTGSST